MKPTLYLETTVPSYLTAWPSRDLIRAGHLQITKEWWQTRRAEFDIYISQFVLDEAAAGDAEAARERMAALQGLPLLDLRVCQQITFTSNNAQARNMRPATMWWGLPRGPSFPSLSSVGFSWLIGTRQDQAMDVVN